MSFNLIIGMGNTGCQIVKAASNSSLLTNCKYYMIDSVTSQMNMNNISKVKAIPII